MLMIFRNEKKIACKCVRSARRAQQLEVQDGVWKWLSKYRKTLMSLLEIHVTLLRSHQYSLEMWRYTKRMNYYIYCSSFSEDRQTELWKLQNYKSAILWIRCICIYDHTNSKHNVNILLAQCNSVISQKRCVWEKTKRKFSYNYDSILIYCKCFKSIDVNCIFIYCCFL